MGLKMVKRIKGMAIFQDEYGFYFEGNEFPYQTEMEAEKSAKAKINFEAPLTNDDGVYKMFEMGLMRKWFRQDEQKKITERWVQLNHVSQGFQVDSDGILRMEEDLHYDNVLRSIVFTDEENAVELSISLDELEECLQIKIGIIVSEEEK